MQATVVVNNANDKENAKLINKDNGEGNTASQALNVPSIIPPPKGSSNRIHFNIAANSVTSSLRGGSVAPIVLLLSSFYISTALISDQNGYGNLAAPPVFKPPPSVLTRLELFEQQY